MATQTLNMKGETNYRSNVSPVDASDGVVPAARPHCEAHWERVKKIRKAKRMGLCDDCLKGKPILPREMTGDSWASKHRVLVQKPPRAEYRRRPMPRFVAKYDTNSVILAAATLHGVEPEDVRFRSNSPFYLYPRGTAAYLLRNGSGLSLPAIGRALGGFHHTTIMHTLDQVEMRMKQDREYAAAVKMLVQQFSQKKEIVA